MAAPDYMAGMQQDDPSLAADEIVAAYLQGSADLRAAVAGLSSEQIRARPVPGRWSVIECVAHLADTEIYFTDRIERTIALDHPLLLAVDEQQYIAKLDYQSFDLDEQLDLLAALRRHAARILRAQPPESWRRTAVHTGSGIVNLRQLVLQATRHLRHHLPFIAEKRAALGAG